MYIFPAIDLFDKKAVRLLRGDYNRMTVYNNNPLSVAKTFEELGARYVHLVDLEGAKDGTTPNLTVVEEIAKETSLSVEIGGGIRSLETLDKYFSAGVDRAILGTSAINDRSFLLSALEKYGEKIVVGADVKDGRIAIKGWLETSNVELWDFLRDMESLGVKNIICTDISKDGAMSGTNTEMYKTMTERFSMNVIASGGVSTIEDVRALAKMGLFGAIIGKAYYTGAIDLKEAIEVAK